MYMLVDSEVWKDQNILTLMEEYKEVRYTRNRKSGV